MYRTTHWIIFLILAASALIPASLAQAPAAAPPAASAAEKLPTVPEVLDHYTAALGGKAAVEKITNRISKGTFELPNMPGTITIYEKAPNLNASATEIPGYGTVRRCFNGSMGWSESPDNGLQEYSPSELASAKRNGDFYREINLAKHYAKLTVTGKGRMNGHDSYLVQGVAEDGTTDTMYFDSASGLLIHNDSERATADGKTHVRTDFDDYRAVDGVKLPFLQRVSQPELEYTIKLTEVKHNTAIDDAVFQKPAGK